MTTFAVAWRSLVTRVREVSSGAFYPVEGGCAGDPTAFEYDLQRRVREVDARRQPDDAPAETQPKP